MKEKEKKRKRKRNEPRLVLGTSRDLAESSYIGCHALCQTRSGCLSPESELRRQAEESATVRDEQILGEMEDFSSTGATQVERGRNGSALSLERSVE